MKRMAFGIAALTLLGTSGLATAAGDEHQARRLTERFPNAQPYVERALEGNPKAMKTLGILFGTLLGDHQQAAHWYRFAALHGNARAQFLLANSYQHGRGVPKSNTLAFAWNMVASTGCGRNGLPTEVRNGLMPTKEEWDAALDVHRLIQTLMLKDAIQPDCSEY